MAKVRIEVEVRDPKSLTSQERKEQDQRWELVRHLLKKSSKEK